MEMFYVFYFMEVPRKILKSSLFSQLQPCRLEPQFQYVLAEGDPNMLKCKMIQEQREVSQANKLRWPLSVTHFQSNCDPSIHVEENRISIVTNLFTLKYVLFPSQLFYSLLDDQN